MGKKNLNPADAYRKAQRKKELKKNKADRTKTRDFALVKKDTTDLEIAIKEFEESRADPEKLAELKAELEKINRKKAEYVAEHPEQRRLVYRRRKEGEPEPELPMIKKRNLFKKNGLPRHPERSIYYDPVMNPFGVAPPGMPYTERLPLPGEVWSDEEMDDTTGDVHLPLLEDMPPGTTEVTSDDEISMPEGPPPSRQGAVPAPVAPGPVVGMPLQPSYPIPGQMGVPPPPPLPAFPPQFAPPFNGMGVPVPPPPPPGFFPQNAFMPHVPVTPNWTVPLPPPPSFPPFPPNSFPPPPPNFLPRTQNSSTMQDPLSALPHQTFQAHRANKAMAPPPQPSQAGKSSLPTNPSLPPKPIAAAQMAAATVSAEPELRDFKKEATAFVPSTIKRKKPNATASKVNAAPAVGSSAAPDVGNSKDSVEAGPARPDLVSALKDQFGPVPPKAAPKKETKSDYDKFMEDMGDILG